MGENRRLLGGLAVCAAAAAAAVGAEIYRETHHFVITRHQIETDRLAADLPELRIAFLSDLHSKVYGEDNEKLYAAIRREQPDLILIGGDMLVGKRESSQERTPLCRLERISAGRRKRGSSREETLRFLERLPAVAPVWYANGNHEQRIHEQPQKYGDGFPAFRRRLEKAGIIFLINRSDTVDWHGQTIRLTGLEPPAVCYDKWVRYPLRVEEITERVGHSEPDAYQILLAHTPEYADEYLQWGADLVLAGHLHGGIVRLPVVGAVIGPQFLLFPRYSGGHYREKKGDIVVSRGLGTHTVNLRLGNQAELVMLTVRGTKKYNRDREGEGRHGDSR